MDICYISEYVPPSSFGGVETVVAGEASYMRKEGHTTFLITFDRAKNKIEIKEDDIFGQRYVIRHRKYSDTKSMLKKQVLLFFSFFNITDVIQVRRILKKEKPDIIHLHLVTNLFLRAYLSTKHNCIYTSHDYSLLCPKGGLYKKKGYLCKRPFFICHLWRIISMTCVPPRIIAVSNYMKKILLPYYKKPLQLIQLNNFITEEYFKNIHKKVPKARDKFIIIFIGRLQKQKGVHLLIEAFRQLAYRNVELWIIGDGEESSSLKRAAGQDSHIHFWGRLNHKDLASYLEKADVLVAPSLCPETFGIVLIEAMAYGIPIIASRIGAFTEIIADNENGILIQPGNVDYIRYALEEIIANETLYSEISKNNINKAKEYSLVIHGQKLIEIYGSILGL